MATTVRQRSTFRFSEDDGQEGPILDEQEQEEVIDDLRKADQTSNIVYHAGLQIVIGLSVLIHVMYLFSSKKVSPLAVLFPDSPTPDITPPDPVPFATALTLLQVLLHAHLCLYCLPPSHSYRKLALNTFLPPSLALPLPLSHPAAIILPLVGPCYALVLGRGRADVLWWGMPGILTALVALVTKWMRDGERDLEELEKLRYTARGA